MLNVERVALIERRRPGIRYYLFPGGQVETGESAETALVREIEEELGLRVKVRQLVAEVTFRDRLQQYYLAEAVAGTFGTGRGAELRLPESSGSGSYTPVWILIGDLTTLSVRPRAVAELVVRATRNGWPTEPLRVIEHGE